MRLLNSVTCRWIIEVIDGKFGFLPVAVVVGIDGRAECSAERERARFRWSRV